MVFTSVYTMAIHTFKWSTDARAFIFDLETVT
jgi:hypothetical protein